MTLPHLYLLLFVILFVVSFLALVRLRETCEWISPIFGWIAGLIYFVVMPLGLIVLNGGYAIPWSTREWAAVDLSDKQNLIPFLTIWTALIAVFILVILGTQATGVRHRDPLAMIAPVRLRRLVVAMLLVVAANWTLSVWAAGGLSSYLTSYWYTRGDAYYDTYGYLYVLYQHVIFSVQVILAAAWLVYASLRVTTIKKSLFDPIMWLMPVALIGEMVLSGNRIQIAVIGIAGMAALYVRGLKKGVAAALVALVIAAPFMSMWATLRGDVTDWSSRMASHEDAMSVATNRSMAILLDTFDGSGVVLLFSVVRDFGRTERVLRGESYLRALIFFVPRSIYPDKSPNFPIVLAGIYEPGQTTSLSATVLGELYANFSFASVLLLPAITAILIRLSSRMSRSRRQNTLNQTIGCLFLIHSIRFGLPIAAVDYFIAMALYRLFALERIVSVGPKVRSKSGLPNPMVRGGAIEAC